MSDVRKFRERKEKERELARIEAEKKRQEQKKLNKEEGKQGQVGIKRVNQTVKKEGEKTPFIQVLKEQWKLFVMILLAIVVIVSLIYLWLGSKDKTLEFAPFEAMTEEDLRQGDKNHLLLNYEGLGYHFYPETSGLYHGDRLYIEYRNQQTTISQWLQSKNIESMQDLTYLDKIDLAIEEGQKPIFSSYHTLISLKDDLLKDIKADNVVLDFSVYEGEYLSSYAIDGTKEDIYKVLDYILEKKI